MKKIIKNIRLSTILIYAALSVMAVSTLVPFVWMLSTSLKHTTEVFQTPFHLIPPVPRWSNYVNVWTTVPFSKYYLNTIKLSVIITGTQMLTSTMAAFSFAKLRFRAKKVIFMIYLSTMMVPIQVLMIPQFLMMKKFGIPNGHLPIILLEALSPFGVFLLRQYIQGISDELIDSAKIDGASYVKIFITMIMPLAKPAMFALGLITFLGTWNDFTIPMIYINEDLQRTLTLGIRTFSNEFGADYGLTMAATVSSLLPIIIVYIIGQRQILKGIALGNGGAIKE